MFGRSEPATTENVTVTNWAAALFTGKVSPIVKVKLGIIEACEGALKSAPAAPTGAAGGAVTRMQLLALLRPAGGLLASRGGG